MRKILAFASVIEIATGLALVIAPATLLALLAGANVVEHAITVGRVGGLALLALGMACWPRAQPVEGASMAFRAMLAYNAVMAPALALLGAVGYWKGPVLWPAVALHAVVAVAMNWARRRERTRRDEQGALATQRR